MAKEEKPASAVEQKNVDSDKLPVVGSVTKARPLRFWRQWPRKFKIIALIVIVLVVAGGAVGVVMLRKSGSSQTATADATANAVPVLPDPNQQINDLTAAINNDTKNAANLGPQQKNDLVDKYNQLATLYLDASDPGRAIDAYTSALKLGAQSTKTTKTGLVYAYAANGQNDKAIAILNQLINDAKTSKDPMAQQDVLMYSNDLARLQQGLSL